MTTKERLRHKIERNCKKLEYLKSRGENLSVHGYWEIGYIEGKLDVLEDWLDELEDMDKEEKV